MAYVYKNSEQKIIPIIGQTFITWSHLVAGLLKCSPLLKEAGFLWNRTVVVVLDKLSSTAVDFIRSERELKKIALIWVLGGSVCMLRTS